jgi:hypothetical protein
MTVPACSPLRLCSISLAGLSLLIQGCGANLPSNSPLAGGKLRGNIHGGNQPVSGASVQLYAAGTTGYGTAATALLSSPVVSGADGSFTITGDYTCPSSSSQLYIVATGGNPGLASGKNNAALAMMTALGPCSLHGSQFTLDPNAYISINEVTTVASVYALAAFMGGDATHLGTSSTNAIGLANSFQMVNNLINTTTGVALTKTPSGNGTVPQAAIDTLANILTYCVNTDGTGTPCATLFAAATASGGTAPTDTVQAIFNVARSPSNQVSTLYALAGAMPSFQPTLSSAPNDWVLAMLYSGGGLAGYAMAIDASGNAWIANWPYATNGAPSSVTELSSNGAILSGSNGYTGSGLSGQVSIAIDPSGNVWVAGVGSSNVVEFSSSGAILSGANGFTGGGLNQPQSIALDGQGDAWVVDTGGSSNVLIKLDSSGNILSGASGFNTGGSRPLYGLTGVGIDRAGNAWVGNGDSQTVVEFSNDGTALSGSGGYSVPGVNPVTVAFDGAGDAWVNSLYSNNSALVVARLNASGAQLSPSGGYRSCTSTVMGSVNLDCFWKPPAAFALDGAGNVWSQVAWETEAALPVVSYATAEMSNTGTVLSGATGYTGGFPFSPEAIAIDGGGNVWVLSQMGSVEEYIGAATSVVTPFSLGVKNGTLGSRP